MTRRTAKNLGLLLALLWLLNLVLVFVKGAEQELYPITCFPMFKRPRANVQRYHFMVVEEREGQALRLEASEMMAGSQPAHSSTAFFSLRSLCQRLEKGNPIPPEFRQLWLQNSQKYLELEIPPRQITLIKTNYPMRGSLEEIRGAAEETVVVMVTMGRHDE